jgi:hypothetical protein
MSTALLPETVAREHGCSRATVVTYCTRYGLGRKIGKDWFLFPEDRAWFSARLRPGQRRATGGG